VTSAIRPRHVNARTKIERERVALWRPPLLTDRSYFI
jgi:hypothetical protein